MKDKCVLCGEETPYDKTTHIDLRVGYFEGVGQTCPGGCKKENKKKTTFVPRYILRFSGETMSMN